jgi:hypothetical protein
MTLIAAAIRKAIYTTNAIESVKQRDSEVHPQSQAVPQRRVGHRGLAGGSSLARLLKTRT